MTNRAHKRVVIVHDWLTGMRGGDKVLESICRLFPNADIMTLVYERDSISDTIKRHRVRPSFVQHLPAARRRYREYLPTFPTAIETFDLDAADLVVSTSHCAAKAIVPNGRAVHVCYCHSPMRYGWDQFDQYFGAARVGRLPNAAARTVMSWLARWDRDTATRVHRFFANSRHVAGRIGRYYNRRASVLYPPVDTQFFTPDPGVESGRYFLVVSALVPYKRLDIAIHAAAQIGVPLHVVGTGPDEQRLRRIADANTEFLGAVSDERLRDLYRGATALVLPAEEDFGIAVVESLACGCPVVALSRGGASESVTDGVTGVLVDTPSVDAFARALDRVATGAVIFDRAALRGAAEPFATVRFEREFQTMIDETVANPAAW